MVIFNIVLDFSYYNSLLDRRSQFTSPETSKKTIGIITDAIVKGITEEWLQVKQQPAVNQNVVSNLS